MCVYFHTSPEITSLFEECHSFFFSEGTTVLFGHSNWASSWSGALWEKCFVLDVTLAFVSHLNL